MGTGIAAIIMTVLEGRCFKRCWAYAGKLGRIHESPEFTSAILCNMQDCFFLSNVLGYLAERQLYAQNGQ